MSYLQKGTLNKRFGKFGIFAACSSYPECKTAFSLPKSGMVKATEKLCPECNYPHIQVLKAKRGMQEMCINPECPLKRIPDEISKQEKHCPKCQSRLILRKSVYGAFWACPGYPKCRHIESLKLDADGKEIVKGKTPEKKVEVKTDEVNYTQENKKEVKKTVVKAKKAVKKK